MASTKPTLLFVHGAGHGPECWELVIPHLRTAGYNTIAVKLPSSGASSAEGTFEKDVKTLADTLQNSLDNDQRDIILISHSYGGIVATEASRGFSKKDRGEDTPGIAKLVYISSLIPEKGKAVVDLYIRKAEWQKDTDLTKMEAARSTDSDDRNVILDPTWFFYNDLSPDHAAKWIARLKPQPKGPLENGLLTYEGYKDIPSWYLFCEKDNAVPPELQEHIIHNTIMEKVEKINASHSPFLSQPEVVVSFIRRAAGESL